MKFQWGLGAVVAVNVSTALAGPLERADAASLPRAVRACSALTVTAVDAMGAAGTGTDVTVLRTRAVELSGIAASCARRVRRATARSARARCGRAVARRGLLALRDAGAQIRIGVDTALRTGVATDAAGPFTRANTLIGVGRTEIGLAPQVLSGRRGCTGGRAAPQRLSSATRRLLPDLARQVTQLTATYQGELLPEDLATFGLLAFHLDTGEPPPAAAVDAEVGRLRSAIPQTDRTRIPGFRTFWASHGTVDWTRYRMDAAQLLQSFETYMITKRTARQNAINQSLAGIVGSEEAWNRALGSWKAYEQRWYTVEQASIAEYDAYRASIDAARVLSETDTALKRS